MRVRPFDAHEEVTATVYGSSDVPAELVLTKKVEERGTGAILLTGLTSAVVDALVLNQGLEQRNEAVPCYAGAVHDGIVPCWVLLGQVPGCLEAFRDIVWGRKKEYTVHEQ
jgi:hypothetical protein